MDHREFLSSLSSETRADLTERSDVRGLVHLAAHLGLIVLLGFAIQSGVSGWQALLIPQGILIVFLFTLLHEAVHLTPFKTAWLNEWAARISGFVLFLPSTWFRYFHFAHHRFTQIPGKDPELETEKPQTTTGYVWHVSGVPTWFGHFKTLAMNASGHCSASYLPKNAEARIVKESRILVLMYALLLGGAFWFGSFGFLWFWIVPALLGQPFLRLYLLAEHGLCPTVANMFENTRTTITNRVVRFIAWNMPFHTEHHTYPTVPFHKLPELHKIMRENLINTEEGYTAFTSRYVEELTAK